MWKRILLLVNAFTSCIYLNENKYEVNCSETQSHAWEGDNINAIFNIARVNFNHTLIKSGYKCEINWISILSKNLVKVHMY